MKAQISPFVPYFRIYFDIETIPPSRQLEEAMTEHLPTMNTTHGPAQAAIPFYPSLSGESCRLRWMAPRRLMNLLVVPSMPDRQPSRLPSLILTPSGPLVYFWELFAAGH